MDTLRRTVLSGGTALALTGRRARAQQTQTIRIGVLTDMSGPNKDPTGPGSVAGAQLAANEFMAEHPAIKVEVLSADHLNKADAGVGIAREWYDRDGVDVIADLGNSAVALGCTTVTQQKDKVQLNTGAGTAELTGRMCSANSIHWTFDSYAIAHTMGTLLTDTIGKTWFFITPDYAAGKDVQAETTKMVETVGGKVVGGVLYPFPSTTEFSSYLLQAQASGAAIVALANGGDNMVNSVKQAHEFGITQRLAVLAANALSVAKAGLESMQGVMMVEAFYWDLNDGTRAFDKRIRPLLAPGYFPNSLHAGAYAAVRHYLKVVDQIGVTAAKASGRAAVAAMERMPTDDDCFGKGEVRIDGRCIHPFYLFEVKKPAESRGFADVLKLVATTPADQAFRSLSESTCPLVRG